MAVNVDKPPLEIFNVGTSDDVRLEGCTCAGHERINEVNSYVILPGLKVDQVLLIKFNRKSTFIEPLEVIQNINMKLLNHTP